MSYAQLLDALHLWLHREGGDADLARATAQFDWSNFEAETARMNPAWLEALCALRTWHLGIGVDLIGAAEDFHEGIADAYCTAVDELVLKIDGAIACGHADDYVDNVIPLRRVRS